MHENPEEKLFNIFPPVSDEQWEELINKDLKGADYEKKLIYQTIENIPVSPYYREGDLKNTGHTGFLSEEFGKKASGDWLVRQDIKVDNPDPANSAAIYALGKGASSIGFILDHNFDYSQDSIGALLRDICLASAEINFISSGFHADLPLLLENENTSRGGALSHLHGSVEYDPLGTLFLTGNYPGGNEQKAFEQAVSLVRNAGLLPNMTVLNVNASLFHNAGASAVQELAYAMAAGAEYLQRLASAGIPAGRIIPKIRFTFSAGSNFFMETAKFRAARYLWSKLTEAWGVDPAVAGRIFIHAVTSEWNKTIYDPYVNILRSTTEAMAAVIGGADSLKIGRFDKAFKKGSSPFAERLARNIQLVLKEEAYFNRVADPSAGSYYIESLTGSLIEESWKLFLETTEAGGITEAFKKGLVQTKIEETARERDRFIESRRHILVGTNHYADPSEKMAESIDSDVGSHQQAELQDQLVTPLKQYRGASAFEQLRLKTEKSAVPVPKVFLLTFGDLTMGKARAGFSAGFFGCAGFEIIENSGFSDPARGVREALEKNASIVVFCSSDEDYPVAIPSISAELKDKAILVVAGYPKDSIRELQDGGIDHFIHLRSNVLETLQQFQKELGI